MTVPARYIEKQKKGEPVIGAFFFIVFLHPVRKPRAVDTITVYMYIFVPQRSGWCLVIWGTLFWIYLCRSLGSWADAKSKLTITRLVSFVWTQRNYWTVTCEGSGHWEFSAVREFARCRVNEAYKKGPKKIQQRWRQWKRRWKIDFASFQFFFCPHTKSPSYLKVGNLIYGTEERGPVHPREAVRFIVLPFPFSSQLKIGSFHVVVVQGRQRLNVQKSVMPVQSYCFAHKTYCVFDVPVAVAVVVS